MRKQYHFRDNEQGLLAWDVDHLIGLTLELKAVDYPLSAIAELNEPYWYGSEGDQPSCKSIAEHMRLVQETDLSYPIILCPAGRVMDGMHRVVKAYLEGRESLLAYRLPILPEPDYIGVAPDDLPYDDAP